jgi:hypothetical protein
MSISSQIRASEGNFKLAQKIVTALSEKYSFDFAEGWEVLSNRNVDNLTKMFRRERRRNDPLAQVKKPRTAFSFFTQDRRPKIQAANPSAGFGDLSRLVSTEWKKLSDKERARFKTMEEKDKSRYQTERSRVLAEVAANAESTSTDAAPVAEVVETPAAPVKKAASRRSGKASSRSTSAATTTTTTSTPATPSKTTAKRSTGKRAARAPRATSAQTVSA